MEQYNSKIQETENIQNEFKHVRFEMEQRQRQNNREKSLIYLAMQSGKPYTETVVETGHEVELINEMEG